MYLFEVVFKKNNNIKGLGNHTYLWFLQLLMLIKINSKTYFGRKSSFKNIWSKPHLFFLFPRWKKDKRNIQKSPSYTRYAHGPPFFSPFFL
jgi:hypothetical protein